MINPHRFAELIHSRMPGDATLEAVVPEHDHGCRAGRPAPAAIRGDGPAGSIVIISDCHLGTAACHAHRLLAFLEKIAPRTLIINGDLCDIGSCWRGHWPAAHRAVIQRLLQMADQGTTIRYIVGNHDAGLLNWCHLALPNIHLHRRLIIDLGGVRTLIMHGDACDSSLGNHRLLWRCAGWLHDRVACFSSRLDRLQERCGWRPRSLLGGIKSAVPQVRSYIDRFHQSAAAYAAGLGCVAVICGHIHQPVVRCLDTPQGRVRYLNVGDWIEHCSALVWNGHDWDMTMDRVPAAQARPAAASGEALARAASCPLPAA